MTLTRKQFLSSMLGIAAGATLFACSSGDDGGGDDDGSGDGDCAANGTSSSISSNHGHAITVTQAEITLGEARTYDIKGTSDHSHSLAISAALFGMLKANTAISVLSGTGDGHTHQVSIGCK